MSLEQVEGRMWESFDKTMECFDEVCREADTLLKQHRNQTITIQMSKKEHAVRFAGRGWQRVPLAWAFFKRGFAVLFKGNCVLKFRETKAHQQDHDAGRGPGLPPRQ